MMSRPSSRPLAISAFVLLASATLLISACSGSSSPSSFTQKNVTVSNVWARESATATDIGVVYFTIENNSAMPDKLFSASVPQTFAKSASLHETIVSNGTTATTMAMDSTGSTAQNSSEMLTMKEIASVPIPANGSVTFEPGGLHVMLIGLTAPLKAGQKFDLNLGFLNAGVIKVTATVKAS